MEEEGAAARGQVTVRPEALGNNGKETRFTMRIAVRMLLASMIAAAPWAGAAAEEKILGVFNAWEAWASAVGKNKVCFMSSLPRKSAGKYKKRGEASVIVTHWPGRKRYDEVSVVAGYSYKKESQVDIVIDGKSFDLYTDADRAWRYSKQEDLQLVRAMRKGKAMVVRGVSTRGTRTRDTYSLAGFTAAHKAINRACGRK